MTPQKQTKYYFEDKINLSVIIFRVLLVYLQYAQLSKHFSMLYF